MFQVPPTVSSCASSLSHGDGSLPTNTTQSVSSGHSPRLRAHLDPRVPFHPPQDVQGWGERLAWCFAQPERPTSFRPLIYPCMPGLGKLGISYGATLVGRTAQRGDHSWVPGAAVMAGSTAVVLLGVVLLGNTAGHVSPRGALWLKFVAIFGGVVMGLGYGLGGLASARPDWVWAFGTGTAAKWTGTALMGGTLPTFVVHATAVLGNLPFHERRGTVAAGLMAGGVASLAVTGALGGSSRVPVAGTTAVTVLSTFACALAAGIYACETPSWPYAKPRTAASGEAVPLRPRVVGTALAHPWQALASGPSTPGLPQGV